MTQPRHPSRPRPDQARPPHGHPRMPPGGGVPHRPDRRTPGRQTAGRMGGRAESRTPLPPPLTCRPPVRAAGPAAAPPPGPAGRPGSALRGRPRQPGRARQAQGQAAAVPGAAQPHPAHCPVPGHWRGPARAGTERAAARRPEPPRGLAVVRGEPACRRRHGGIRNRPGRAAIRPLFAALSAAARGLHQVRPRLLRRADRRAGRRCPAPRRAGPGAGRRGPVPCLPGPPMRLLLPRLLLPRLLLSRLALSRHPPARARRAARQRVPPRRERRPRAPVLPRRHPSHQRPRSSRGGRQNGLAAAPATRRPAPPRSAARRGPARSRTPFLRPFACPIRQFRPSARQG